MRPKMCYSLSNIAYYDAYYDSYYDILSESPCIIYYHISSQEISCHCAINLF